MEDLLKPKINIITRASRINYFKLCYDSIHNQTYTNVNHIVTYETPEIYDKLKHYKDITLIKVPHKTKIKGLVVSWNHNCKTDNYLNPDHEFLDYQALDSGKDSGNNRFVDEHKQVEESFYEHNTRYAKWHGTGKETWREYGTHAPYNWYLKIAEKALQDGWVMYVDDDDQLQDIDVLDNVVKQINKHDPDTLHIFKFIYPNGQVIPDDLRTEMYKVGYPLVHKQVSGVNLCFPTKYADYTYWDEWSSADYRTAKSLREIIPNLNPSYLITVKLTKGTNGGLTNDLD